MYLHEVARRGHEGVLQPVVEKLSGDHPEAVACGMLLHPQSAIAGQAVLFGETADVDDLGHHRRCGERADPAHLLQDVHCSTVGGQHLQHPSDLGLLGLTSLDLLGAASEQQGHRR